MKILQVHNENDKEDLQVDNANDPEKRNELKLLF